MRSKHERGTDRFYEYATISVVQDGVRLCVYSRPVTLLDVKVDVVRELVEEARRRGVKIKLVLLDRAFFTVECINLLEGMGVDFITPCVCNERVQAGSRRLVREGGEAPFLDLRQLDEEGSVLHDGGLLEREEAESHTIRDERRGERPEARRDDTEGVQEALGDRDVVQEGEGGLREDAVPFPSDKAGVLHGRHGPVQPLAGGEHGPRRRECAEEEDGRV